MFGIQYEGFEIKYNGEHIQTQIEREFKGEKTVYEYTGKTDILVENHFYSYKQIQTIERSQLIESDVITKWKKDGILKAYQV